MSLLDRDWQSEIGSRVLTAVKRSDDDGEFWTTIDRDTGELIGSFGIMNRLPDREAALDEAERFGSKWAWPVDRDFVEPTDP